MKISKKLQKCMIMSVFLISFLTVIYWLIRFVMAVHRWNWNY